MVGLASPIPRKTYCQQIDTASSKFWHMSSNWRTISMNWRLARYAILVPMSAMGTMYHWHRLCISLKSVRHLLPVGRCLPRHFCRRHNSMKSLRNHRFSIKWWRKPRHLLPGVEPTISLFLNEFNMLRAREHWHEGCIYNSETVHWHTEGIPINGDTQSLRYDTR